MLNRVLCAAAFACASLATATSAETIRLVQDEAYAPYMGVENGAPTGIWVDVITEALSRIEGQYDVEIDAVPWSRAVNLVESGQAHGLIGTYVRRESRPWIGTYSTAPITEKVSVYCRNGVADAGWSYPEDFSGLTFGNNAGFGTPGDAFFDMVSGGLISLQEAQTTEQNLMKLDRGRIDCYVQEQLAAEMVINDKGLKNVERVLDTSAETAHVGFRGDWQGAEATAFMDAFDAAVQSMLDDGTIDAMVAETVGS
ncbi:transporter substrate-binding domain-containing protein [Shimia sp. R9_2]|uniref:substrate-binding periplasmic protein n=1 Tax=Shimia sp. R9_2 TaxID=2821112 RepID=UPI001ADA5A87|nr:transporter substrate-binding domain-containing protein [Shimia sp. R9_2]MBO9398927.1 transporter substrate-binding domain-containing protein [Shimia sp. R9_2]